jgi:hypothetical protein
MRQMRRIALLLQQDRETRWSRTKLLPLTHKFPRIPLQGRMPNLLNNPSRTIDVAPPLSTSEGGEPLRESGGGGGLAGDAEREGAEGAEEEPGFEGADGRAGEGAEMPAMRRKGAKSG